MVTNARPAAGGGLPSPPGVKCEAPMRPITAVRVVDFVKLAPSPRSARLEVACRGRARQQKRVASPLTGGSALRSGRRCPGCRTLQPEARHRREGPSCRGKLGADVPVPRRGSFTSVLHCRVHQRSFVTGVPDRGPGVQQGWRGPSRRARSPALELRLSVEGRGSTRIWATWLMTATGRRAGACTR